LQERLATQDRPAPDADIYEAVAVDVGPGESDGDHCTTIADLTDGAVNGAVTA
jgi:hypothetical protein